MSSASAPESAMCESTPASSENSHFSGVNP
jgi:hypothetical protein